MQQESFRRRWKWAIPYCVAVGGVLLAVSDIFWASFFFGLALGLLIAMLDEWLHYGPG